jgi:hypothetical protein
VRAARKEKEEQDRKRQEEELAKALERQINQEKARKERQAVAMR